MTHKYEHLKYDQMLKDLDKRLEKIEERLNRDDDCFKCNHLIGEDNKCVYCGRIVGTPYFS